MGESLLAQPTQDVRIKKALIAGAVLGACVGLAAAYIYIQNIKEDQQTPITPGDGVKLGVMVFGLLRSIASLGEGKEK